LSNGSRKREVTAAPRPFGFGFLLAAFFLNVILCGCAAVGASNSSGGAAAAPATTLGSSPTISTSSLSSGTIGAAYLAALQASGGTAPYTWSVASGSLPTGLSLAASTGVISGVPNTVGAFSPTIRVTDAANNSGTRALSLAVALASVPAISTSALAGGTLGTAYSATLQASGGTTPYSWSIVSGSLPAGLSLAASTGVISGAPTAAGTASFTAQVEDAASDASAKALSIAIGSAPIALAISTSSLGGGTVGTAYSATLQAGGGTAPYTWSIASGSLPAGLSLTGSTGVISGTPTASGTASFTVKVKDAASNTTTEALSIAVAAAAQTTLSITTSSLPQASTSSVYSANLQATGGTPAYTWSISSGSLPAGLSLLATTGQITGTATSAGAASFTAKVTDSAAHTATIALSIAVVTGVALDQYGGRTDVKCASATGWFHTEKLGGAHWTLCTPLGNAFYAMMMNGVNINMDSTWTAKITSKYGSTAAWTSQANTRLLSWDFNTLTTNAYLESLPIGTDYNNFPVDANGIHSQPVKMPFTLEVRPALYSMNNSQGFLTNPTKNMLYVHSPYYTGYVASGGVADYYDSGISTWMQKDLVPGADYQFTAFNGSPYANYIIGIMLDDGDEMNGFSAGPDFPTQPSGHNNYNLGMMVAAMSPLETANSSLGFVYADTLIHSKLALRNALASEYGTVSALNAAWGSSYTSFDSSGICVGSQPIACGSAASADSVGTGTGSKTAYTATLSHTTISGFSLQILVGGTRVAGDLGNGTVYGSGISSGSINYATGALSITFASAPASGAAITADYVANGWGIGTGFLDEDDRPTHNSYLGTDWTAMSNANPKALADLNVFLEAIAAKYFSDCETQLKAVYPNVLDLGPDSLNSWNGTPPAPVLKAAALYTDAFVTANSVVFTQPEMDFIEANYGDKPYFGSFYSSANPDSALSAYTNNPPPLGYATQAARGAAYAAMVTAQLETSHTTAGNYPYIGVYWWEYTDNFGEQLNWGIVTHLDNAYDGHEAVTGSVACSAPLQAYTCGGESGNYGNLVTPVKAANALWLSTTP